VLGSVLEMVRPQIEERHHTLQLLLPEEEIWLNGDPVRLAQIFVNLLTNSAKYTDPGGIIVLHAYRQDDTLVVSVKDSGIGIAPERLKGVFEPFGGSRSADQRQTGLRIGLSLAKRMTEMHHGSIRALSEGEGKGTEVVVEIPLPDTAPLAMPAAERVRVRGRFSQKESDDAAQKMQRLCILVVDDNEPAARSLGVLLGHYGHEVLLAYDAPEALRIAGQHRPDVAILDIGLPAMDGYQLAKEMRAAADYPIICIALTGYGQPEDRQRSRDAGFAEHLVKPVSIVDVERVLRELRGL
jgi:CheY-like chemotaxis protein/anti-sigma regulatory factor (Ser/Thr protein kinase)